MEREEYRKRMLDLSDQIGEIQAKMDDLKEIFIESNKSFEVGDIVEDKDGNRGFVVDFFINWETKVVPNLIKQKKDGSKSKQKMFVWHSKDLKKV